MVNPATWWFEIVQYNCKQAAKTANLLYHAWLCRYTRPTIITYNHGDEFHFRIVRNFS